MVGGMIGRLLLPAGFLLALTGATHAADMFGDGFPPCGDQKTTLDTVNCVDAKTRELDQRLNKAYAALLKAVDPPQVEPLRRSERLWAQYRDANCAFYGAGGGTISRVKAAECARAMTQDRAQELEAAAKQQP